jgi:UDP-glucose 4-epimerase
VLVTGGSGFIGQHVVRRLAQEGHAVTLLQRSDRHPAGVREVLRVPELTPASLRDLLRGKSFDWMVHMAGAGTHPADRDIEILFRLNVDVTRALTAVSATWPARAVFVAGSGSEYAPSVDHVPVVEKSPLEAHRVYAASKAAGTLSAVAIATALSLPLAVGRLFGVYGPGEAPHRLLPSLFGRLRAGARVPLSTGEQQCDFVYVDDAVDAILRILYALEHNPKALIMNIAGGEAVSVRSFAETVADVLGADRALLGFGDLPKRPDEISFFCGDPSLIYEYAGWKPRYDLRAGITRGVELLKQAQQA